ncbi:Cerato-ulmin like protein [Verticillium longisporum]|uniref:Hydrophobin n=3 Tax=Verticillium TaxID=1036719 RepID=G2WVD2_VERDV|nr:uncharacterized protein VDAG_02273 [Verticillium dahliae VdLs.17]AAY89101.1 class II hydrophobin [Verticillium dahliae]KAG7126693.1 Cerato-ulmin like protein [Verticillium longisporum]EGY20257.1 hypothetical protein VDAG_02273 [Verticillium dahliae VdLs.17]KAG7128981.1 Cerato-ulmin like protein [Verticillium longisporum]KAG7132851.1 Cerato-ulmin like protein [Verticillium longisporum]
MRFSIATIALFAGAAMAHPANLETSLETRELRTACSGLLHGTPLCCSTSILGLAVLDCSTPKSARNGEDMRRNCNGKQPQCCTLGISEIALLCQRPIGA